MFRYGIFKVGQIWRVVGSHQCEIGFPSRAAALAAAQSIQRAHRMCGEQCELLAVDEVGRLVELTDAAAPDEQTPVQARTLIRTN